MLSSRLSACSRRPLELIELDAFESDLAAVVLDEVQQRERHRALAATGLADQRQRLPLHHVEAHALHRVNDPVPSAVALVEIADFEQSAHRNGAPAPALSASTSAPPRAWWQATRWLPVRSWLSGSLCTHTGLARSHRG